ncbi:MAG TPA: DHH family phosphoesterase [Phycisphaerae bacterium]|nr:DHH family phosphoesterase [Phycisphaerae bacterium]HRR83428.1 DHH family phosphoesterase [Phycisphaerae bacterium]
MTVAGAKRSDHLLKVLSGYQHVLVLTHDNPDPDAIASGWAVAALVRAKAALPVRFVAGGAIFRAENRRMVELLEPPLEFVEQIEVPEGTATVLVDAEPHAVNHLLGEAGLPTAVIDHHQHEGRRPRLPFCDIRPKVVASATIAAHYLREQHIDPGPALATALTYAIRTDATGLRGFSAADHRAMRWLSLRADHQKLTDIENAPLQPDYYADLLLAMQNTFLYEDVALCFLPRAGGSEIIAEVADLLIRHRDLTRVMVGGVVNGDLLVSVRSKVGAGDASDLVARSLEGLGHGGGHCQRAGGKVPGMARGERVSEDLQSMLRNRWLGVCGVDAQRGMRLVPKREILENL